MIDVFGVLHLLLFLLLLMIDSETDCFVGLLEVPRVDKLLCDGMRAEALRV
jgi:hypothetical protein